MTQLTSGRADRILGVVLAGGASRRFGSPKWSAELAGRTMGERAVAALEPNTAKVGVVGNDPALAALGVEVRSDLRAGKGPLGALHTALHWAQELSLSAVFLLACDLPLAGAEIVRTVVDTWTDDDVVVPFGPRGPEPLCGLYSVNLLPEVERALSVDELALHALMERVHARRVPMHAAQAASGLADPFLNVNTREDLARATTALSSRVAE
jgi:molybdopterin-guanine dinucleotide biosynthesis protein A